MSIETFYKKCHISKCFSNLEYICKPDDAPKPHYICRYRINAVGKRKFNMEPILLEERSLELLRTPEKQLTVSPHHKNNRTPRSLVKKMSEISIKEEKTWSVKKVDNTKLLLRRAIFTDKVEKNVPKSVTPTKKSLSMELIVKSDEKLPTLIIRENVTPSKSTPRDSERTPSSRKSSRIIKSLQYKEEEDTTPKKDTPKRSVRKRNISCSSEDEFRPSLRSLRTPTRRTPVHRTPKKNVVRKILHSQLTPTLKTRVHTIDNADGKHSYKPSIL